MMYMAAGVTFPGKESLTDDARGELVMEGSDQWIQAERILIQGFLAVLALTHKDSPADFL